MATSPFILERVRPSSVPIGMIGVVAAAAVLVPPLVLEPSTRTYAIAAAFLLLAGSATVPYAVAVAVATLPLQYLGVATYTAPRTVPDDESLSVTNAVRHVAAGFAYVLAAGAVGGIGVGLDVASSPGASTPPTQVPFTPIAGVVVGLVFVGLQLWRYDAPLGALDAGTVLGTVGLGLLMVPAGRIAVWIFGGGLPF
jgi:hypothetical protein